MRVYQSADGKWIFFDGTTKYYFDTQTEAVKAMNDAKLVRDILETNSMLGEALGKAKGLWQQYWDIGGSVSPEALAAFGITSEQFAGQVTTLEQFGKFGDGQEVTTSAYRINMNVALLAKGDE